MSTHPPSSSALKQEPDENSIRDTMVDGHVIPQLEHHYIDDISDYDDPNVEINNEIEEISSDLLEEDDESNKPTQFPPEKNHISDSPPDHKRQ